VALLLDGTLGVPVTTVTGTLPVANGGSGGSTSTGTGAVVLASSPSLTTPALGTPASGVLTNCTGTITLGTAVASTSGTSIDFTGIPTGTQRITISLVGVSQNTASRNIWIQLGDAGGVETSGYLGAGARVTPTSQVANETAAFQIGEDGAFVAADIIHGTVVLSCVSASAFTWTAIGITASSDTAKLQVMAGSKSLSQELDRVRITTDSGVAVFDAGVINISYAR